MKDVTGNVESFLIFFMFNRHFLQNLKEADIANVEELEKHAASEEIETKMLILTLIPDIEILNNELIPDKLRNEAYIFSEKWAKDYNKIFNKELLGEEVKDEEEVKEDD